MKKVVSGIIFILIGGFLVGGVFLFVDLQETIDAVLGFSFLGLLIVAVLTFLSFIIGAWRMQYILKCTGCNISFWGVLNAWLAGHAFNYVTPFVFVGGEGVKAYILKEKHGVPWNKGAASLAMDRVLDVTLALLVVVIAVASFLFFTGFPDLTEATTIVFIGVLVSCMGVSAIYYAFFKRKRFITRITKFFSLERTRFGVFLKNTESQTIDLFSTNLNIVWYGFFISFLKQAVVFVRHIALFYYIVKGIELIPSLFSLAVLYISFLVPLPGAVGSQEILQAIVFPVVGFGAGEGLALSIILRGVGFVFVVAGVYIMFYYGVKFTFVGGKSYNSSHN